MSGAQDSFVTQMAPRFQVETAADGGRRVVIPALRSPFIMAFVSLWLCAWTIGGITVAGRLIAHFQPFLALWLCGWVFAWTMALTSLLWMLAGQETIQTPGGNLEISASLFGVSRRRLYRGVDIRDLASSENVRVRNRNAVFEMPFLRAPRNGAVKFSYGGRTVYAGVGLDEAEGRMIVDLLKRRLPKSVG